MGHLKLQLGAILCCFVLSVLAQSDKILDPVNFETIPPDRAEELLEQHFQLVLRALDALSIKVDRRVGDLDAKVDKVSSKISVIEGTLSGLDSKIEAINVKLEPVESMVHSTEDIRKETGEALQKIIAIEDVVVHTGSVVRNMSIGVDHLKDQMEIATNTTTATPLKDETSGSNAVGSDRSGEIIRSIHNRTSGRLYTGPNFTGQVYSYDLTSRANYDGCVTLPSSAQSVRSVNVQNGCVRLFSQITDCHGLSLAIYPGSDNSHHHLLNSNFTTIQSIGPCADNEFEFSTISNSSSGIISFRKDKLKDIPDFALLGGYWIYKSDPNTKSVSSTTNPVLNYLIDSNNNYYRIKYFRAEVYERHLEQTPEVSQMKCSSVWRALEKKDGDDLGFIIPLNMGGPGNVPYNVFPQSKRNGLNWAKVLKRIRSFVTDRGSNYVILIVDFVYPDEVTNRPHGFYYWLKMTQRGMKQKVVYGFIRN